MPRKAPNREFYFFDCIPDNEQNKQTLNRYTYDKNDSEQVIEHSYFVLGTPEETLFKAIGKLSNREQQITMKKVFDVYAHENFVKTKYF